MPAQPPVRRRGNNCEELLRQQSIEHQATIKGLQDSHAKERRGWQRRADRDQLLIRYVVAAVFSLLAAALGLRYIPGWPFH